MKARYFLRFSYIGTYFRGSDKLWMKKTSREIDPETVHGVIEIALNHLRTLERPQIKFSSRTDAGVHALNNTAHIDIDSVGRQPYDVKDVAKALNGYFIKNKLSITINDVKLVPETFHARHSALSRTYLYRFATLKKNLDINITKTFNALYPVEEWRRCVYILNPEFDIEKFAEGAKYFPGLHDWSSFMKFNQNFKPEKHNRRLLMHAEVRRGNSLVPLTLRRKRPDYFDYWDFEVKGKGFVHNQIRRMMGVLKAVATDAVPVEEIKLMLQIPSKLSWPTRASVAPPHGLYLTDVEYDPLSFEESAIDNDQKLVESDD